MKNNLPVFALIVFACTMVGNADVKERVCSWQFWDYYNDIRSCIESADKMDVDKAYCTRVSVI